MQEIVKKQDLYRFSYFLSNEKCFFHRYCDTGFKTKWTGFWCKEYKFLEYFAFQSNGVWLSPETCKKVSYNGIKAEHFYKINNGQIKETVYIPEKFSSLIISLQGEKPMQLFLELAVNIRKRAENVTQRRYTVSLLKDFVSIRNRLGSFGVKVLKGKMIFKRNERYKTHYPSGEEQKCFIPGEIFLTGNPAVIELAAEKPMKAYPENPGKREAKYQPVLNTLKTDNPLLKKGFDWSVTGIELLRKKYNSFEGFYAGLPWFQQMWSRDVFWVLPSLIDLGYLQDAKNVLQRFANLLFRGRMQGFLSKTETSEACSVDSPLLWIISLERYVRETGDIGFLMKLKPKLTEILGFVSKRTNSGFLIHDLDEAETWMDTLRRGDAAIDVQSIYYGALKSSKNLLSVLKEETEDIDKSMKKLKKSFEIFCLNEYCADRLFKGKPVEIKTANPLLSVFFKLCKQPEKIMETIESPEFTSEKGVRTRSNKEFGFSPSGYHTGSTWSITTAWASACEFIINRPEAGWFYLKKLIDDLERDSIGCIGECWDSFNSRLIGCGLQLWGSGFIPSLIDDYMLGIHIDSINKEIRISPKLPEEIEWIERTRMIGKNPVKLIFKKKDNKILVSGKIPFTLIKE